MSMCTRLLVVCLLVGCCPTPVPVIAPTEPRMRVVNGCRDALWIFYTIGSGGGSMAAPTAVRLGGGEHYDYPIPDEGLASARFWAGYQCDESGQNCVIGQSSPPCPAGIGCAPAVDSKFEGTFGCLASVPADQCLVNPSAPSQRLPHTDGWDTSMVDGYTLPFRVHVTGTCGRGPVNNEIDCSQIMMSQCPTEENLSTNGAYPALTSVDLHVTHPTTHAMSGCLSDCARLTYAQWNSGTVYQPGDPQASSYCCPTPPISPSACSSGPVASTLYTQLVHRACPQVYAYAYDDVTGNFTCDAGTHYEVTFYCPPEPA